MNPAVVIATHNREAITCINITTLLKQSVIPKIVLVVSERSEETYFNQKFPQVTTVITPNKPLGNKWQKGITVALESGADPIILTGSDDILERRFVERACLWMERKFDFIGLKDWYVLYDKKLFHFKYLITMPLGGGRVYSARFLKQSGNIFESKNRHLDDLGWQKVKFANIRRLIWNDPFILSVKGNWPVMNDPKAFFSSRNCELRRECDLSILKSEFNYEA